MGEPPPFDPCECIFSPAAAMRRLISLLRNSQQMCNDEQCFGDNALPPGPSQQDDGGTTMMYMAVAWVVFALVMFFMRPQSLRADTNEKPSPDDTHRDGTPRPPPVM